MSSDVEAEFNQMTDFLLTWQKDADDSASTTVTTNRAIIAPTPLRFDVIAATWIQHAASTLNATQYATLTLNKNDGAGSTMLAVAAKSTQSNTISARTEFTLAVTASARRVNAGQALWINIGKTGAKKIRSGMLTVHCRRF
jgi:hypothetical protein